MKQILEFNGKTLILIGTAHISEQSVQEVRDTLESTQADTIAIELDDERYKAMNETQDWQKMDIVQIIKKKKVGFLFAQMILSSYQRKSGNSDCKQTSAEYHCPLSHNVRHGHFDLSVST